MEAPMRLKYRERERFGVSGLVIKLTDVAINQGMPAGPETGRGKQQILP